MFLKTEVVCYYRKKWNAILSLSNQRKSGIFHMLFSIQLLAY